MINFIENHSPNVIAFEVTGKVTKEDMLKFEAASSNKFDSSGKVNVLMIVNEFKGYTFKGLIEDIMFGFKHFKDFNKVAIVSDKKWLETMVKVESILPVAELKHFVKTEAEQAWLWINQ